LWKKLSSKNFPQAWPAAVSVCPGRGPEGNECGHVRFIGKNGLSVADSKAFRPFRRAGKTGKGHPAESSPAFQSNRAFFFFRRASGLSFFLGEAAEEIEKSMGKMGFSSFPRLRF